MAVCDMHTSLHIRQSCVLNVPCLPNTLAAGRYTAPELYLCYSRCANRSYFGKPKLWLVGTVKTVFILACYWIEIEHLLLV